MEAAFRLLGEIAATVTLLRSPPTAGRFTHTAVASKTPVMSRRRRHTAVMRVCSCRHQSLACKPRQRLPQFAIVSCVVCIVSQLIALPSCAALWCTRKPQRVELLPALRVAVFCTAEREIVSPPSHIGCPQTTQRTKTQIVLNGQ